MTDEEAKQFRTAFIGLGSNIGDREHYIRQAVKLLNQIEATQVVRESALYETEPVGYVDQPPFLNKVVAVRTALPAEQLFQGMMQAEEQLGRVRDIRWGPRTIDLDLLSYDGMTLQSPNLILPHPRMLERAFVLIPLLEIVGEEPVPGLTAEALHSLEGKEGVQRWKDTRSPSE